MSFKQKLRAGIPQVGIRSQLCNATVVEALGFCGFDYIYIDMEHSPNDLMSVLQQAHAIAGTKAETVVRIPSNDGVLIQRLLDVGVENIVVPMVDTPEEAKHAASAAQYPPHGIRSRARVHRGNGYGTDATYESTVDDRICLAVQIESEAAAKRAFEIASVQGVDAVLFGPADLAADMGHTGNTEHPAVVAAIDDALKNILKAGKFAGMSTTDPVIASSWLAKGCHLVSIAGDLQTLVGASRRQLEATRQAMKA
jgi:2-keto-3-deoxy-L-rhamnonate aldolase RhmA